MMGGFFVSVVNKGCKRNVVSYNSLINGYCKNRKVDEAMRL
jgi:pentatricopeptide repeat domain-containing protein 1